MVADDPTDGRCNAQILDKVGLDVHDEVAEQVYTTGDESEDDDATDGTGRLVGVVLSKGAVTASKEPEYPEVAHYLREGFDLTHVELRPYEDDDGDDPVQLSVEDDDPYVTNHDTDHVGFCERWPVKSRDADRCPMHGGTNPGAPEGNVRAVTHGLKAKRSNYYEKVMSDDDRVVVEQFVDSWLDLSSYSRDDVAIVNELYRIAVDQIRLWNAQDEFDKGMVYEQYEDIDPEGGEIHVDKENPANLPYDRLDRTTFGKLKDLGVLDSPEDKQAEATESLAEKFENLGNG